MLVSLLRIIIIIINLSHFSSFDLFSTVEGIEANGLDILGRWNDAYDDYANPEDGKATAIHIVDPLMAYSVADFIQLNTGTFETIVDEPTAEHFDAPTDRAGNCGKYKHFSGSLETSFHVPSTPSHHMHDRTVQSGIYMYWSLMRSILISMN